MNYPQYICEMFKTYWETQDEALWDEIEDECYIYEMESEGCSNADNRLDDLTEILTVTQD